MIWCRWESQIATGVSPGALCLLRHHPPRRRRRPTLIGQSLLRRSPSRAISQPSSRWCSLCCACFSRIERILTGPMYRSLDTVFGIMTDTSLRWQVGRWCAGSVGLREAQNEWSGVNIPSSRSSSWYVGGGEQCWVLHAGIRLIA